METPTQSYERPRPPYTRTASRSSTSTTNTRMTPQSANSSTSQIVVSPQLTTSHSTHRFHHASCAKPTTPRPTPRLSREASIESTRQTAVSSFLQERLQRERRAESEKLASASRSTLDNHSSSTDLRLHHSPTKNSESERRPLSSAGSEKRGLGVKDMEQVISGLHKQNFDLKLELYHRRERQTALEQRVELLESEKTKSDELNEKLGQEMEQRDKAIEEAVAMIITLEARMEQFAKERDIVRHIEAERQYAHFNRYEMSSPKNFFDDKTLARMPSFLSDKSENTENLRNVYLGVRGSMLSLPQVAEGSGDAANTPASPSMSVLSESSFVSVYGQKTPEVDVPLSLDGVDSLPIKASDIHRPKTSLAKPAQTRTARSNSMSMNGRQFESITNVIDQGSPLQRIERTYIQEERPESRNQNAKASATTKSPTARRRDEKREGLRKVTTDSPGGVRLHDHALPPTPDTISTSTLRRFQNSDDTLPRQEVRNQPSIGALSDVSAHDEKPSGVRLEPEPTKVRDFGTFDRPMIRRPRSAGETTVSHRGNDWDSDSDSDTKSLESSLDIWMRESAKPDRRGRASPDLFGFPSTKGAWAMDAMFGPSAYGSATVDPERLLEMLPTQPEVFTSTVAPPAPHRRSSLHAQTGSNQTKTGRVQKSPTRRKGRRNSDDPQIRAVTQPTPTSDKKHYPPIAGHQGRNPLTKLFRRSLGGSTESTPVETNFADIPRSQTAMGVPSWINRDDDRDSATPPPIMRNPRQSRGPVDLETEEPMISPVEITQEGNSPRTVSAMGTRRKWLPGFGRNSMKNKG